jgi:hypothetical protein
MSTYDASIKRALLPQQNDLRRHKEYCSADAEKLATVGRLLGHQVRQGLGVHGAVARRQTVSPEAVINTSLLPGLSAKAGIALCSPEGKQCYCAIHVRRLAGQEFDAIMLTRKPHANEVAAWPVAWRQALP